MQLPDEYIGASICAAFTGIFSAATLYADSTAGMAVGGSLALTAAFGVAAFGYQPLNKRICSLLVRAHIMDGPGKMPEDGKDFPFKL